MLAGSLQKKKGYFYVVTRISGKQKWISTGIQAKRTNLREANAKLKQVLDELDGSMRELDNADFAQSIQLWLKHKEKLVRGTTFHQDKQTAETHFIPYFTRLNKSVREITPLDISRYYANRATNGKKGGGGLAKSTLQRQAASLRDFFDFLVKAGTIKSNPCCGVKLPKMESPEKEAKAYNVEQCETLLRITEGEPIHDMIFLTIVYGLRREELMGLRWQAIDFKNKSLTINHTATQIGKIKYRADTTKTESSRRQYPLTDEAAKVLKAIKQKQNENRTLYGELYEESDYVFTKPNGGLYAPQYPTTRLREVLQKTDEIPHLSWHALRHTCATLMIGNGAPIQDVTDWLGHSNISITYGTYVHPTLEHKCDILRYVTQPVHTTAQVTAQDSV